MDTNERFKALTTSEPTPPPSHTIGTPDHARMQTRRKFLTALSLGMSGVIGAGITVPLVGFILGPLFTPIKEEWQSVGLTDRFSVGETVQIKLNDVSSVPWAGLTSQSGAWLRRKAEPPVAESFVVWAVNCTHLGCPVSWLPSAQLFLCPCHGGSYYSDGSVAGGPPPLPLQQYPVRVRDGKVEVLSKGIPTITEG